MMGIVCAVIGHRRDAKRARSDGFNYRAPCRRCGTPMIKDFLGDWRPTDPKREPESVALSVRTR